WLRSSALVESPWPPRAPQNCCSICLWSCSWYRWLQVWLEGLDPFLHGCSSEEQGTGISWIGVADPWSGFARVYLDGVLKTVDSYGRPKYERAKQRVQQRRDDGDPVARWAQFPGE